MLSNRIRQVFIGGQSKFGAQNEQWTTSGCVVNSANLYHTIVQKFLLANDLALAIQYSYRDLPDHFAVALLNRDLVQLEKYYASKRPVPNADKTEISTLHLNKCQTSNWSSILRLSCKVQFHTKILKMRGSWSHSHIRTVRNESLCKAQGEVQ